MIFIGLLCGLLAAGDSEPMRTVDVDAGRVIGTVRSLQGVNGGPPPVGFRRAKTSAIRTTAATS